MKITKLLNVIIVLTLMLCGASMMISCEEEDNLRTEINNNNNDISDDPITNNEYHNGHECVDLGLPSGIKWATTNIGAVIPTGYGFYIAWGETTFCPSGNYSERNNKYYSNGNVPYPIKYTQYDGKYKLDKEDDAASVNWGDEWRTPTVSDFKELCENSDIITETINGVVVCRFTSKINHESIIIPFGGMKSYTNYDYLNERFYILSSELNFQYTSDSFYQSAEYCACLNGNLQRLGIGGVARYCGVNVRPVYGSAKVDSNLQTCSRCDGSGTCQTCYGTGKCPVCKGNYKKYNSSGYPVECDYCLYGKCPGCDGNKKCNLCKGTGKH